MIDALDHETPLRLTATTRGVMVSGTVGALGIAPTLHFVELGLKISGEEWIKVMDEYIASKCTALVEPGRSFYCTRTARRRTLPGWFTTLQDSFARHSRVSTALLSISIILFLCKTQLALYPTLANPAELWAL